MAALAMAALAAGGCSRHHGASAPTAQSLADKPPAARQTPSGLPVPRYISLKYGMVNARAGPGDDYPLKWIYRAKGLPLEVVAETEEWRRVCDSQGSLSWVHKRTTSDTRRTVLRASVQDLPLYVHPSSTSAETAELRAHAIAELKTCRGGWCELAVGRVKGWAPVDQIWGVQDVELCRDW